MSNQFFQKYICNTFKSLPGSSGYILTDYLMNEDQTLRSHVSRSQIKRFCS